MKKELFSVHDTITNTFNIPFAAANAGEAQRMIAGACTPDTTIYKNADDYRVYHVGDFNMETGEIQSVIPVMVSTVREVRDAVISRQFEE